MWIKVFKWFMILLPLALLILLFTQKSKLDNYLSKEIKSQSGSNLQKSVAGRIDSLYNYQSNGKVFQATLLEFGAKGCVACTKMEAVLKETKETYPAQVKVVFLNILKTENQDLMKYYGIAAIPTQVLLDGEGSEYFRHTGYISFIELRKKIDEQH